MKIMLVDDSKTMRNMQRNALNGLGHTDLVEAGDGQQALEKAEQEKPELILLDWNMPNVDGLAFLKQFRATDTDTPVIMITTELEKRRVIEAIKAGVNNYIVKPFTQEALAERIEETLEQLDAA